MRGFLAGILMGAALSPLSAQPADPDLVLPDMILRVEDLKPQDLPDRLPDTGTLPEPSVELPLPPTPVSDLPPAAFRIEAALPNLGEPGSGRQSPFTVYSQGAIGAGSMNYLLGKISLFKIGQDPRFSLAFFHESMDGYWNGRAFRETGSYTFQRTDRLDLSVQNEDAQGSLDLKTSYGEDENGLQQRATQGFQTVLLRTVDLSASAVAKNFLAGRLEWAPYASYAAQVLSSPNPISNQETRFGLDLDQSWSNEALGWTLGLGGRGYEYWSAYPAVPENRSGWARAFSRFRWIFLPGWETDLDAAYEANFQGTQLWPAELRLSSQVWPGWTFRASGGWKSEVPDYGSLWTGLPVRGFQGADHNLATQGWYAGLEATSQFGDVLRLEGGVSYDDLTGRVLESGSDAQTGLLNLVRRDGSSVRGKVGFTWKPGSGWTASGSWRGAWGTTSPVLNSQEIQFSGGWSGPKDDLGFSLDGLWSFTPGAALWPPEAGISGFWKVWDGIKLTLEAQDIPSLFLPSGREVWGGFLAPGFQVRIVTQISL